MCSNFVIILLSACNSVTQVFNLARMQRDVYLELFINFLNIAIEKFNTLIDTDSDLIPIQLIHEHSPNPGVYSANCQTVSQM